MQLQEEPIEIFAHLHVSFGNVYESACPFAGEGTEESETPRVTKLISDLIGVAGQPFARSVCAALCCENSSIMDSATSADPMHASQSDGYPDTAEGQTLHKSASGSGFKGVSVARGPPGSGSAPCYTARDGSANLGTFSTRVEAALAYARSRELSRDVQSHQRQDHRRQGNKRKKSQQMHVRPEAAKPGDASSHYSTVEAQRYTAANVQIQHDLAVRCLEFLQLGERGRLLLDIGCGSCLSSQVIGSAGHHWIGTDVAREMLLLATKPRVPAEGALLHSDMAAGLPLRAGCQLDGAISVSALQWLCEPPPQGDESDARRALRRLFDSLRACLQAGGGAVFQFYTTPPYAASAHAAAVASGFDADLLIDLPHATRARKLFLCARTAAVAGEPQNALPGDGAMAWQTADAAGVAGASEAADAADAAQTEKAMSACVCPIAWPFAASCVCSSRWLLGGSSPPVFPRSMDAVGCCMLASGSADAAFTSVGGAAAGAGTVDWLKMLYRSCGAHRETVATPAAEAPATAATVAPAATAAPAATVSSASTPAAPDASSDEQAAALGRLQQQHMKYVRRILHALHQQQPRRPPPPQPDAATASVPSKVQTPAAPAPSTSAPTELQLYLSGGGRGGGGRGGGGRDGGDHGGACESAMLVSLHPLMSALSPLVDALIPQLASLGLSLDHAHHQPLLKPTAATSAAAAAATSATTSAATSAADQPPAEGALAEALELLELPVPNAAPHSVLRLLIMAKPTAARAGAQAAASRIAACLRAIAAQGVIACALEVNAASWAAAAGAANWQPESGVATAALDVAVALRRRGASGADAQAATSPSELTLAIVEAVRLALAAE